MIITGAILLALGGVFSLASKVPGLGRLPGDILIRRENFTFYFPLTTGLIISIILSVVFTLVVRLLNR